MFLIVMTASLSFMNNIQQEHRKAVFILVGNLNEHHQEWLGLVSGTDRYGVAANDFSNFSGCIQLINGPTL